MTNSLASKIAQASKVVGALRPDKKNTAQNYDYISADKILERAGDALADLGVVVFPAITDEQTVQSDYTDNYGKAKSRFDAVVRFRMLVADDEHEQELPWCGRGSDFASPDKALYKAITSGHKYFLMKLLNVGVGNEDGEHESEPAQTQQKAQPKPTQRAPVSPAQDVDMGMGNPFDGPSDEELVILGTWKTPDDAQNWAVTEKHCKNIHHARESFTNIVEKHGGRLTKANVGAVYLDYLRHQLSKSAQPVAQGA